MCLRCTSDAARMVQAIASAVCATIRPWRFYEFKVSRCSELRYGQGWCTCGGLSAKVVAPAGGSFVIQFFGVLENHVLQGGPNDRLGIRR